MKFIKKFFVIIVAILLLFFLFVYRQYNLKKVQEIKNSIPTNQKQEIICNDEYEPVCWEDKKTYSNSCVAERINEVIIAHKWECKEIIIDTNENLTWSWIWESNLGETETWITNSWETYSEENKPKIIIEEKLSPDYYKNLRSQCNENACCLSSVDTMENSNYKEAIDWQCKTWYIQDTLKCEESYKWCVVDSSKTTTTWTTSNSTGTINWQKVLNYSNSNFNYWFSVPAHSYYSWYWAQNWASHTVWISTSSWVVDFAEADVKVYYYKGKILPELEGSSYWLYKDPKNWRTYIELNWNSFIIEWNIWTEKIVDTITKTIYAK